MTPNYGKFYALLKQLPEANKEALVYEFTDERTTSLKEMKTHEYQLMVAVMAGKVRTQHVRVEDFDTWRKRVMASIGGWLKAVGSSSGQSAASDPSGMIKAIACRAAGRKAFNEITLSELRAIYAEFNNKQKVAQRTKNLQV